MSFSLIVERNPHTSHLVSDTPTSPFGEHPTSLRLAQMWCMRLYSSTCFSLPEQIKRSFIVHTSSLFGDILRRV
jgi:hypothetical protein